MTIPTTQKVILIEEAGDFDVIQYKDFPVPEISENEVLVKNKYAGINFIENYFRLGFYPFKAPYVLGREASGYIAAVGSKVTEFKVGDKVAYMSPGTFSQYQKISAQGTIVKLPDDTSDKDLQVYGSTIIQGLTAITLTEVTYKVQKGDFVLVYAAAGGVGQILTQICHQKGAHAIAVASTDAKLQIAKDLGAEYLINSSTDDVVTKVKEFTDGEGVAVAYDSLGKDYFEITKSSLAVNGSYVSFGNATGKIPPFSINELPKNISISRPTVMNIISNKSQLEKYFKILFDSYRAGEIKFDISQTFPLKEYREADELLVGRKTTGKLSLAIPQD